MAIQTGGGIILNSQSQAIPANIRALAAATDGVSAAKIPTSLFQLGSSGTPASLASANSGTLVTTALRYLAIDIWIATLGGTSPQLQFNYFRVGLDGNLYGIWLSAALTAAGKFLSVTIGPGVTVLGTPTVGAGNYLTDTSGNVNVPQALGNSGILSWTLSGTTPTATGSISVIGES